MTDLQKIYESYNVKITPQINKKRTDNPIEKLAKEWKVFSQKNIQKWPINIEKGAQYNQSSRKSELVP